MHVYECFSCTFLRYTAITGVAEFVRESLKFGYGEDCEQLLAGKIAATQSISGTGGCRLAGELVKTFFGKVKVYIPNPTWGNHLAVYRCAGLEPVYYKYYDPVNKTVDFEGLVQDIENAEDGSFFMLHACAHNPTGCDPTRAQWDQLSQIMLRKQHLVLFDCAYQVCSTMLVLYNVHVLRLFVWNVPKQTQFMCVLQGFASGDAEADAYAIRKFAADGHLIMLSQSYAKVYGNICIYICKKFKHVYCREYLVCCSHSSDGNLLLTRTLVCTASELGCSR
jgi:aspartate aminotransferase, mitochondrial